MNSQDFPDRELNERLNALKVAMQEERAPERVELALVDEVRRRQVKPAIVWWRRWEFAAAAAVVLLTAALAVFLGRGPAPANVAVAPQPVVVVPPAPPEVMPAAVVAPQPRVTRPSPRTQASAQFIPLVPDLTWMPGEGAQVLRVSMPRSALRSFGLPVDENRSFETVRADIVVGQDMVARAIRLVR